MNIRNIFAMKSATQTWLSFSSSISTLSSLWPHLFSSMSTLSPSWTHLCQCQHRHHHDLTCVNINTVTIMTSPVLVNVDTHHHDLTCVNVNTVTIMTSPVSMSTPSPSWPHLCQCQHRHHHDLTCVNVNTVTITTSPVLVVLTSRARVTSPQSLVAMTLPPLARWGTLTSFDEPARRWQSVRIHQLHGSPTTIIVTIIIVIIDVKFMCRQLCASCLAGEWRQIMRDSSYQCTCVMIQDNSWACFERGHMVWQCAL